MEFDVQGGSLSIAGTVHVLKEIKFQNIKIKNLEINFNIKSSDIAMSQTAKSAVLPALIPAGSGPLRSHHCSCGRS